MKQRIAAIDGFRTIAVLGVLWIHIWAEFKNPALQVGGFDISPLFSFWGMGVDLFFVISGFCMYLMQFQKMDQLKLVTFLEFLKKRWLRIAPAFYVVLAITIIVNLIFYNWQWNFWYPVTQATFTNTLFAINGPGTHFWSLNTEWHYYFFLPILMVLFKGKTNLKLLIFVTVILVFRWIIWDTAIDPVNFKNFSIPNRILEFLVGMYICKLFMENKIPKIMQQPIFFFIGFAIAFAGRVLLSDKFHNTSNLVGHIARTVDLLVLAIGFGVMILSTLGQSNIVAKIITSKASLFIGKSSYSFYLWHWLIMLPICQWLQRYQFATSSPFATAGLAFIISLIILVPLSKWSFNVLENYYFKNSNKR